jgi:hypothetical protein
LKKIDIGNKLTVEVQPCPFCGEGEDLKLYIQAFSDKISIKCFKCLAMGPVVDNSVEDSKIVTALKWNNRRCSCQ